MYVAQECGQRWYRHTSWFPYRFGKGRVAPEFRRLVADGKLIGWAYGPMMLIFGRREKS